MFVILQKYDFSSKSQLRAYRGARQLGCLWYCKSTIFQANHNWGQFERVRGQDVCDTAKVRFFKQITTLNVSAFITRMLFAILQKDDFSSKSQRFLLICLFISCCLRYCKSTIFQANHNKKWTILLWTCVVCDTAKVRFFKQITTVMFTLISKK